MTRINSYILKLISKYISKEFSEKEFNELKKWIKQDSKNEELFINHLKVYKKKRRTELLKILDEDIAWKRIVSSLKTPLKSISISKNYNSKTKFRKLFSEIPKYAAAVLLLFTIGYFYQKIYLKNDIKPEVQSKYITLQLENGTTKIINTENSSKLISDNGKVIGNQKGNELVYNTEVDKINEKLVYNTLFVPYGKRFKIKLSDGTLVHLNAGSSLKYPIKFLKGQKRTVFLNGEAYFSVTKDLNHPFIVNAEELNIEVLGTEFNVSSYPEDAESNVVLVEGSVGMYKINNTLNEATMLIPGVKGTLNKESKKISTEKVNTFIYTSWREGGLFFRKMTFKNIAKKIERHYNMKIIIKNKLLENEIFNANFNEEPIENILSYFSESYKLEYKIENNKIFIN